MVNRSIELPTARICLPKIYIKKKEKIEILFLNSNINLFH